MDSPHTWAPRTELVILGWTTAVGAVFWLVMTRDPMARLFAGAAALLLIALCAHATVIRPRLLVDQDGVSIREIRGVRRMRWNQFRHRLRRTRRFGIEVAVIEIDVFEPEEHLIVLTQLDLGTDPLDVDQRLSELRLASGG